MIFFNLYRHKLNLWNQLAIISLSIYGSTVCITAYGSKDISLTANITFSNGEGIVAEVSSDTEFRIKTCAGKLKFPVSSLAKIETSEVSNFSTVHLRSGDHWVALIADNILSKLDIGNSEELINQHGKVRSIYFNSLQETSSPKPLHYMKLILNDGSRALINTSETVLSLETIDSKSKFPIGALRALKFIKQADSDEPDSVIIRFHTGLVRRIGLGTTKTYIRTIDCNENKLKVYHRDILGILSSTNAEGNFTTISTTNNGLNSYQVMLKNGQTKTASIPVSIWKFRTDLGTILVPSPMIASFKSNSKEDESDIITTVYGEKFLGKLLKHELQVKYSNGETRDIEIDKIDEIGTDSANILPPDKWLVWYMKSGSAMLGCFANESTGLVTDDEREIESDNIFNLTPITDTSSFLIVRKNSTTLICTPTSRRVKIVLLTTGMTVSIPWEAIYIVKAQKVITPSIVQSLKSPVKKQKANKTEAKSSTKNSIENDTEIEDEIETIKIRSAIGTLDLNPSVIATISIDKTASRAFVTSIYTDRFIISIPSQSWFEDLLSIEDYEFPEEDIFEIKTGNSLSSASAKNSFICRLIKGDILHGNLPEQDLRIKKNDSKSALIKVDISKLQQISRNDDGDLTFHLQRGNIFATPKQRKLEAVLWVSGKTNKIAFKQIESLIVNSTELPPITHFHPGLPADLKNEIFVEGGEFMQGSENGILNEMPVHTASVNSFYMDSTEVTRAQFAAFVRKTEYETLAEQHESSTTWKSPGFIQRQNDPAVCLSWNDAIEYCNWRSDETDLPQCYTIEKDGVVESDRTAMGYRLPTEAEWEFAARNRGQNNIYAWNIKSTQHTALANYYQTSSANDRWTWTNPVQAFLANGLGIFGLSGNVWEWCEDLYFDMAYSSLQNNTVRNPCITHDSAPGLTRRVMRGGSFKNRLDLLRCTSRGNGQPYAFSNHVGFRCVRNGDGD